MSNARSCAGRVFVWDASTGRCIHSLEGPGDAVEWLAWHPRGDVVLAGCEDFSAWMWHASTGACMQAWLARCPACACTCMHVHMQACDARGHGTPGS
jgi:WD40 repeat protein